MTFEDFVQDVEQSLRQVLVARLGIDRGREATAEALAWAFENWTKVQGLDAPMAYLARVGTSRTRGHKRRGMLTGAGHARVEPEPQLMRILASLTQRQRVTVVLVHGYEWTTAEVAAELGISPSAVKTHLSRGLERIRREMGVADD